MKLLIIKENNKKYSFVSLENKKDVAYYCQLNKQIKSKQAISFWMGFKSQTFRSNPVIYLNHEVNDNTIATILAFKLRVSDKPTSIVQYCNSADSIIMDMNNTISRLVNDGHFVRLNSSGGYCPIKNDYTQYSDVITINEQELYNFLLYKDIKFEFKISKPTIVIENDDYIPDKIIDIFSNKTKIKKEDIQIITSFKHKSILFKKEDFIKFFAKGLENGLKNIVFETTAQDQNQINEISQVFEYLMNKFPNKKINIYIRVAGGNKHLFETKAKNIKIIFL